MKRGLQRYSRDVIRSAIKKREEGVSLSAIAKDMGIAKTTVKYWLDNPNKFMSERNDNLTPEGRVNLYQTKLLDYGWKYIHNLTKNLSKKEENASFRDIVFGIRELAAVLGQIQIVGGHEPLSGAIVEVSEQTSVTYRRFLEKKKKMESTEKTEKDDLRSDTPDRRPPASEAEAAENKTPPDHQGNGANG